MTLDKKRCEAFYTERLERIQDVLKNYEMKAQMLLGQIEMFKKERIDCTALEIAAVQFKTWANDLEDHCTNIRHILGVEEQVKD